MLVLAPLVGIPLGIVLGLVLVATWPRSIEEMSVKELSALADRDAATAELRRRLKFCIDGLEAAARHDDEVGELAKDMLLCLRLREQGGSTELEAMDAAWHCALDAVRTKLRDERAWFAGRRYDNVRWGDSLEETFGLLCHGEVRYLANGALRDATWKATARCEDGTWRVVAVDVTPR